MLLSDKSIDTLRGVGQVRKKQLERLGIRTIDDLICHFPRAYEDRSCFLPIGSICAGQSVCIKAYAAHSVQTSLLKGGMSVSKVRIFDDSGAVTAVFFNRKYVGQQLREGMEYCFFGKVDFHGAALVIVNPEFESAKETGRLTGRILPVYRLTAGLTRNAVIKLISEVLPEAHKITDILPTDILEKNKLCRAADAYRVIHMPLTLNDAQAARMRLAYEEIFLLCLRLRTMRIHRERYFTCPMDNVELCEFTSKLDFELTEAQKKAIELAFSDMTSGVSMNRLIQGDVGSGKTAVAAACIFLAAKNGFQSIMMAPTEILALQHFNNLKPLFDKFGVNCALLTGSAKKSEKTAIYNGLADGTIQLLIGTHAVLNDNIKPLKLGLVITDEQHRFGVAQRLALSSKAEHPHTLLLSATPIPRTLALILFHELDISIIDELPKGRIPVKTFLIGNDKRQRMYGFIKKLVAGGGQGYIVCPAVSENENENIKAAVSHASHLKTDIFPDLKIAVLHGKMKSAQKSEILNDFYRGNIDLLVCTSVIEVGIDVPNASIIVVENAERFGLSALHQLRGRVGRGDKQSYCILINGDKDSSAPERLKIMTAINDGFTIAEQDLKQRGPGDFFGMRQHGLPQLKVADFLDIKTLQLADRDAEQLLNQDPSLSLPQHRQLARALSEFPDICS